jgi:hypothetical protein
MSQSRYTIEVTDAYIERARKNDSYRCVVAQAIARTIPDATRIEVDVQTIRFTVEDERRLYLTPYVVQGYVVAFDAGDPVVPFKFQLRDPKRLRRRVHTKAGKAIKRARNRAATKRVDPRRDEDLTPSADVESVKAAYAGEPQRETTPGERIPPRVFKRKKRSYGHRLLRINQESV